MAAEQPHELAFHPLCRPFCPPIAALLLHPGKSAGRVEMMPAGFFLLLFFSFFSFFFFVQLVSAGRGEGGACCRGDRGWRNPARAGPRGWGRGCADRHIDVRQIQRRGEERGSGS